MFIYYNLLIFVLVNCAIKEGLGVWIKYQKSTHPAVEGEKAATRFVSSAMYSLMHFYNWTNCAIVVENKSNYQRMFRDMKLHSHINIIASMDIPKTRQYSYGKHYKIVKKLISEMSKKARIIIMLASVRVIKECLIAAAELNLVNGDYAYLVLEIDLLTLTIHQNLRFKWTTADFADTNTMVDTYTEYVKRSSKLCKAWQPTFMISPNVQHGFNLTTTALRNMNDTLQYFAKPIPLDVGSPFQVFHLGTRDSIHGCFCQLSSALHNRERCNKEFPVMERVGKLNLLKSNRTMSKNGTDQIEWLFQYEPFINSSMYWPNNGRIEDVTDDVLPISSTKETHKSIHLGLMLGIFIPIVSTVVIVVVVMYIRYLRKKSKQAETVAYTDGDDVFLIDEDDE